VTSPPLPPAKLAWTIWGLGAVLYVIAFYQRVAPAVMTSELMADFGITAAALGHLSAFYFYSYVGMQIPTGIIADRWGPRRLLTAGAFVAALGSLLFALAPNIAWAYAGRLLIGGSVAVAFVCMLKLASHWMAPRQFALAGGMALFCGIMGAVFAGVPLRLLVSEFGWRAVMLATAAVTLVATVFIWRRVHDDPAERGFASHVPAHLREGSNRPGALNGLLEVLRYPNVWLLFFAPGGVAGPVLTFAGLWGVPYLTTHHGLATTQAAAVTSAFLIAWAIGGPIMGAMSDRIGRRKPLYVVGSIASALGWSVVIFMPRLPTTVLAALLVVIGFSAGCMVIGFAFAKESVPLHLAGTVSGVANMGVMTGGMVLQPLVGWMLDRYWTGATLGGVRTYDLAAFQHGFALMLAWGVISVLLVCLTRETYCTHIG
jgi:MFS family permease